MMPTDPVPQSTLEACARTGRAYTNEVRKMAAELLELRAQRERSAAPLDDPYAFLFSARLP